MFRYLFSACIGCSIGFLAVTSVHAADVSKLALSGSYLGVYNAIGQENTGERRTQFDFAGNLEMNYQISERVNGNMLVVMSPGNGTIGFEGPELVLSDVNVTYTEPVYGIEVTMGSFDTPFGRQTANQTNNADSSRNPFFLNSLMYAVIGGRVGTLNTLGMMGWMPTQFGNLTAMVSNGRSESAENEGETFSYLGAYETPTLFNQVIFSAAYWVSDDSEDANLGTEFTGHIVDADWAITPRWSLAGYLGGFTYDDDVSGTDDDVSFWMGETTYRVNKWITGFRISEWRPIADGGVGASSHLPVVGFAGDFGNGVADTVVVRTQYAIGYELEENLTAKFVYFHDAVEQGDDTVGGMVVFNGSF
ncbi:MAG: hypothetical protein O3A01_04650 [bacterium]|nr:hypothetical protein [bacterium]